MNAVHVNKLKEPQQAVPEGDVPGDDPGAAAPHPAAAGDQLVDPGRGAQPDRRRDAGLRRGIRALRYPVLTPSSAWRSCRRRSPVYDLAVRPVGACCWSRRKAATCRRGSRRPTRPASSSTLATHRASITTILALLFAFVPAVSRRLLDVHDHHHLGLSADVPVVVPGGDEPAQTAARPSARLPRAGARAAVLDRVCSPRPPRSSSASCRRPSSPTEPGDVRPDRGQRGPAARRGHPLPAVEVPKAELAAVATP